MRDRGQMTPIDVLPDDVLLAIFDFYMARKPLLKRDVEAWQSLVHVCRRWRFVVFASPRRLNLRLVCTNGTPVRERLDVWPALPLIVKGAIFPTSSIVSIVVALGHSDRVCQIDLDDICQLGWNQVLAAMQVPFPALTDLVLRCWEVLIPIIPDNFLGGSAPRLRYLDIDCAPFSEIPNLLLSATHLINLELSDIPHSWYASSEAMATCLSVLTRLRTLSLSFNNDFPYYRPRRRPPPMTRFTLPDLTSLSFKGANEYLDDLVAWIDAPRLDRLSMSFPIHQMALDIPHPHLAQFISRTQSFEEPTEAHVILDFDAKVKLLCASDDDARLWVEISYDDSESSLQPSFIAQVCAMCFPSLPTVENLRLGGFQEHLDPYIYEWKDDVENDQWLELLRPLTAVKNLYLSEEFQPDIASVLQELVGDRTTEVLPSLQSIFLAKFKPSGPFREAIGQFVAARQLSGHPIDVLPL